MRLSCVNVESSALRSRASSVTLSMGMHLTFDVCQAQHRWQHHSWCRCRAGICLNVDYKFTMTKRCRTCSFHGLLLGNSFFIGYRYLQIAAIINLNIHPPPSRRDKEKRWFTLARQVSCRMLSSGQVWRLGGLGWISIAVHCRNLLRQQCHSSFISRIGRTTWPSTNDDVPPILRMKIQP